MSITKKKNIRNFRMIMSTEEANTTLFSYVFQIVFKPENLDSTFHNQNEKKELKF